MSEPGPTAEQALAATQGEPDSQPGASGDAKPPRSESGRPSVPVSPRVSATAEQIVRALAAASPVVHRSDGWARCGVCAAGGYIGDGRDADDHDPDCPWRLAVEWVDAQQSGEPRRWFLQAYSQRIEVEGEHDFADGERVEVVEVRPRA